ncbi:DNA mismatch repair ATPase MutS [Clostridium acetobutylicum]|uniref:MutS-like mismatch repair protein, ATPases n=1 Tax=Clostridium acetobutylicum (strain ATCC 824 / DSM 792 / JCM 1419 / IAM 19013 / LMG 5710 / NBRC 13948 / NRRL B-527 / VKM B-1787 / 2291 / W) TaxID=272562 RepID=Q97ES3_CLOAB|nr:MULTISPECIES: MutS family DNA mismatch repair protein [Clostridium]AAK80974.1 MutS-like mismatch repair protein, ATPases [Clostridium acetobutylicum ATCC 824]ADZ22077.1 MutS-like mismatch repair protein, ATPase [Clostridium acetobutylicum EA 2018]AEI34384.1 MutS-like mismatch repair protein, ATPase [Clostridium acetobutylicum DSM 1731]AWV78615.1 MutS family DNA mismatch repair protein [Clostridium acetobutylicum]MBC2393475.1 MutS family DNA mismatch repair protein [Clostridium acetobutylicu
MDKNEEFLRRIENFKSEKSKLKQNYNMMSLLRFIVFIMAISFTYFLVKNPSIFILLGTILSFVLFVYILKIHEKISDRLEVANNLVEVNEKYLKRIDGTWTSFQDFGEEFQDEEYPYLGDLDIFGKKSLFQLINTCVTFLGRKKLAETLKKPDKNIEKIRMRQKAVEELKDKIDFCQNVESQGNSNELGTDPSELFNDLENTEHLFKNFLVEAFIRILPVVSIVVSIVIIYMKLKAYYWVIAALFVLHMLINIMGYLKVAPQLRIIYKIRKDLKSYFRILDIIENEDFKSDYLKELKSVLYFENKPAYRIFKSLISITEKLEFKNNIFGYVIFGIIMLWDYQCVFEFERWKDRYGKIVSKWVDAIGEFESLSSLSVIFRLNSHMVFPELSESGLVFSGKEVGHPLIGEEKRVNNDVDMNNKIFVITGANMAGKTTFLRTVGINLVLAYAGAPVCASNLKCSVVDIYTSMRITDDLNNGMSTFYVELMRVKKMIENVKKKTPMIFLIDEIFHGTNSNDRIAGAKKVLKILNENWIFGLISTHDFELCELESDEKRRIKNYHFSETYLEDKIIFDYKLKDGPSDTTNAKYLMKMIGINVE